MRTVFKQHLPKKVLVGGSSLCQERKQLFMTRVREVTLFSFITIVVNSSVLRVFQHVSPSINKNLLSSVISIQCLLGEPEQSLLSKNLYETKLNRTKLSKTNRKGGKPGTRKKIFLHTHCYFYMVIFV